MNYKYQNTTGAVDCFLVSLYSQGMHLSLCAIRAIGDVDTNECQIRMLLEMYGFDVETVEMLSQCSDTVSTWKGGVSHQHQKRNLKEHFNSNWIESSKPVWDSFAESSSFLY